MPRAPYHIDRMYCYVALDPDGDEGIPAFTTPSGLTMPLIAADPHRLFMLQGVVADLEKLHGQPFKLIRLDARHEVTEEEKAVLLSFGETEHKEECDHESEDFKHPS